MSLENLTDVETPKWFLLGQSVRRGVRKEATMYSYNGVVLPKLPEWDKTKYPHLHIYLLNSNDAFHLLASDKQYKTFMEAGEPWFAVGPYGHTDSISAIEWTANTGDSEWTLFNQGTMNLFIPLTGVKWATWDVIDPRNNSVFLSASDPIPVYK